MTSAEYPEILSFPEQIQETSGTHRRSYTRTHYTDTQVTHSALPAFETLKDAALISLDGGFGSKSLLKFARGMKSTTFAGTIEQAFDCWWTFAKHRVSDDPETRDHLLILFRATVKNLKPSVVGALTEAADYAAGAPQLNGMSKALSLLAHGCTYLQRLSGKEPFFLSVRGAAKILRLRNPFHASAYLLELERIGWIKMVSKGQSEGRKASTFKLLKKL